MTGRLPTVRPHQAVRALEKAGWHVFRERGSHLIMHKEGYPQIAVIPVHTRDLPRGTLHGIVNDAGLTDEEFAHLLRDC